MAVEAAVYINTLNVSNPLDADNVSEGKLHLRLIKTAVKATFPNVTAAVTATAAELNGTIGVAARVTTLEANRLRNDTSGTVTGDLNVTGTLFQAGYAVLPPGMIVAWYGAIGTPPGGWLVCDGAGGLTPDLRDRFIIGAGGTLSLAAVVGANAISSSTAASGSHAHTGNTGASGSHTHGAYTDVQGSHSHSGNTAGTVLSVAQLPAHTHLVDHIVIESGPGGVAGGSGLTAGYGSVTSNSAGSDNAHVHAIYADGNHYHNVTVPTSADHSHSVSTEAAHAHTYGFDNRPASMALVYIMKI